MKVSYQWLSEYLDLSGNSAAELAEKMTRSGIEVDAVENRNKGVTDVYVGYVKTREKHPDADKLSVCTVDVGRGEDLQIVCGAPNVAAGQKVPVAIVGAKLPGDLHIKRAKLRGVESQGMICSARELGLNDKLLPKEIQEGILVLPEDTQLGANILNVLAIQDEVLELDLTPDRSDCLSMIGVAYEFGAILDRKIKLPDPHKDLAESHERKANDHISVKISAPEACSHYAARLIENVKIGPSPLWMQNRLMASGIRPINNIVDITNYVMLEYGQPLHAFDADRLNNGHIDVRMAVPGDTLVTLDDVERKLEPHMLLITDGVKPVALAGVMGGANSEVTADTSRILLESAHFAGGSVRKTSRQLGLRSEASLRFEKEANPEAVIPALNRAAALIAQYADGRVAEGIAEARAESTETPFIPLTASRVNQYLGTDLTLAEIKRIFDRLQFAYETAGVDILNVKAPSRRGDIIRDVDLIGEVARIYGYDNIPTKLMSGVTTPGALTRHQSIRRSLRTLLTQSGLHEAISYSVTDRDSIKSFPGVYPEVEPIALSMPMSEERSVLRTSLVPSLMQAAAHNRNRNIDDVALFEIGSVFITQEAKLTGLPEEKPMLTLLLTGKKSKAHWSYKSGQVDFYDLKGIVEKLASYYGIDNVRYAAAAPEGFHPGRTAEMYISGSNGAEISLGRIGQLHPSLQHAADLGDTYVAEIRLDALYEAIDTTISYKSLPRFPAMTRDIAVVVEAKAEAASLIGIIKETAGTLLESVHVFDVYTGERLGEGKKSVAISLAYRHPEKTLTDEEVSDMQQKVVQALEQSFGAELRK